MQCDCGAEIGEDDRFCEECGRQLGADATTPATREPAVCSCGAGAASIDPDGFCTECGRRIPTADPRDHGEIEFSGSLAAVTDRGHRHRRNEDDMALAERDGSAILVVSDGVSVSLDPQRASRLAVEAAVAALADGPLDPEAVRAAILAAHQAVLTIRGEAESGAATIALAVVPSEGDTLLGWIGDSRIYAVSPAGARQLSRDHSWLNEVVDQGLLTLAEAMQDRARAHALSRWLGDQGDGSAPEPAVLSVRLAADESVLVCSDGLWNYAPSDAEMARLLAATGGTALATCRQLVEFANSRGGVDNVTAALFRRHETNQTIP